MLWRRLMKRDGWQYCALLHYYRGKWNLSQLNVLMFSRSLGLTSAFHNICRQVTFWNEYMWGGVKSTSFVVWDIKYKATQCSTICINKKVITYSSIYPDVAWQTFDCLYYSPHPSKPGVYGAAPCPCGGVSASFVLSERSKSFPPYFLFINRN